MLLSQCSLKKSLSKYRAPPSSIGATQARLVELAPKQKQLACQIQLIRQPNIYHRIINIHRISKIGRNLCLDYFDIFKSERPAILRNSSYAGWYILHDSILSGSIRQCPKILKCNIENSMHIVCLLAKLLFKFNQYVIQIQPANDIASYKRFANQIMNDKERKYSQDLVEKAQQSNIGDMKRLKDVEVQYDVTVFQTAGQFWNFQYDEFFKPTMYRYQLQTDQKFLQMRVEILIAAAQFFLFKAGEPEAATIAMLTAHQFLNKMENEVLNAAGAAMSAKQFAGVLDKKYPYDFTEFVIEIKKNKQCVDAFKSIIAVTKDSRTKELKELSK
ncbi:Hypothetical_protein [Hexamita inflata]|uniref:Hypothetical_protein n=1 Tax=Hexamita inflata TaxID=28002 RepID=A0ABP1KAS8_9EUKA